MTEIVATKVANAQFPDARANVPEGVPHRSAIRGVLDGMRTAMGGLWVGGRVTLTTTDVAFAPNGANAKLHSGEIEFRVALEDITAIKVTRGVGTSILEIQTPNGDARFRCYGANGFADQIREQQRRAVQAPTEGQ